MKEIPEIPPYKSPFDKINDNIADVWKAIELVNGEINVLKKHIGEVKAMLRYHVISCHGEEYYSQPQSALYGGSK